MISGYSGYAKLKPIDVILGRGEIGEAIASIFMESFTYDIKDGDLKEKFKEQQEELQFTSIRLMHVCFPYFKGFEKEVNRYKRIFKPEFVVIHSTVPVGTSRKVGAVHSPCEGLHPFLARSILTFTKFLGGENASNVADYFRRENITVYITDKSETTEYMKIMSTTFYGMMIEFTKQVKSDCTKMNIPFELFTLWNMNYNESYEKLGHPEYKKPLLVPIMKKIGAHCLLGNEFVYTLIPNSNKELGGLKIVTLEEYYHKKMNTPILSFDFNKSSICWINVNMCHKRMSTDVKYEITNNYGRNVEVTDKHIFLKLLNNKKIKEVYSKDLKIKDYLPFINSLPKIDKLENYLKDKGFKFDKDFCRLIGYYLAEGCVSECKRKDRLCTRISTRFSFNKNEIFYIEDICNILKKNNVKYNLYNQRNVTHIGFCNRKLSNIFRDYFGCNSGSINKEVPKILFLLPNEYKEELIKGYFRGDGCYSKNISCASVSRKLIEGIDLILLSMGVILSKRVCKRTSYKIEGRIGKANPIYVLQTKGEKQYNYLAKLIWDGKKLIKRTHNKKLNKKISDNLIGLPIKKIIKNREIKEVYSVETDNGIFITSNGLVIHNCVLPNTHLLENDFTKFLRDRNEKQ